MSKRKTKKLNKELIFISVLLGITAICMIFLPAFKYDDQSFTGLQSAFGYTEKSDSVLFISAKILEINVLTLIAYILPIGGIIIAILSKKSSILSFISGGLFIVAGVCGFLSITTFPETVIGNGLISLEWELAYGMIICAVCSLLAGIIMVGKVLFK